MIGRAKDRDRRHSRGRRDVHPFRRGHEMKIRLTLMAFAASMIVACAGKKVDSGADLAADARAVLVVSNEDGRYIDAAGMRVVVVGGGDAD